MDEDGIARICNAMGLNFSRAYQGTATWGSHMSIACPLAVVAHNDIDDDNKSCSVEVVPDGPSRVKCWSGNCRFKGSLLRLVRAAVRIRGSTPELLELFKSVAAVEAVTLAARHTRSVNAVQKILEATPGSYNRETIPEDTFTPYAGQIPHYAIERGITLETAKAWGLGYDKEGGYLVFPVRRRDGQLVGLVGRAVSDQVKKTHHNYVGLDKSRHLFGAHMMEIGKPVVVVEACVDALNTWQALEGEVNVVASLGEGFSDAHARTISSIGAPATYVFTDGDHAGRLIGNKMAHALRKRRLLTRVMECPWGPIIDATADGKPIQQKIDPTDLPAHYIRRLYREAPMVRRRIKWTRPPPFFDPDDRK